MNNLQPGQMLGPYRIISQVGQGGMATVYKAYQPSMDRNVAVKVLPSQLAESKEFTKRFQQEARIIARLEHAHILPVFDYGESDGISYFVMRYLEAGTLKEKMESSRPLPLNEIDRIFTQLADALSYAHSQGVIHRDLKPANALIDSQGNLFLTDFGIAKLLADASPRLTQTDAIMGTPAYISPEQAQAQTVDQRSDIYSLGIILYEMVAGRVPFVADTPLAVILKHVSDPMPLPSTIKANVPEVIEKVILKALAKNPDDRFATAADFVAAWKNALDAAKSTASYATASSIPPTGTSQTQLEPASVSKTASKPGRSKGWIAGCLIGACLLLSVAGVFVVGANWQNLPFFNSSDAPSVVSGDPVTEEFEIEIGDEISNGEPDSGAGLIEAPGSKDIYTFTADAGQVIYVHVIEQPETSGNVDFYMTDDLGLNVFYTCMPCDDPGTITLDRGGTYTLTIGNDDPDGAGTGAYRIKLWDVPPPDTFEIELEELVERDEPDTGAGYIENPGSTDEYVFTADAGQTVYFQVVQQPQTEDWINWVVFDEADNSIFDTCLKCGDPGLVTLDEGGTYTIYVGNQSGAGTGTYQFRVWDVPPPEEFTIEIGDKIAKNIPGTGAGFIEKPGSHDIYTFTATAGQTVTFAVIEQLPNWDSIEWILFDEDGNEVFNTCLPCGDPGSLTLDRGGTYTLIVGSDTTPSTGAYELHVSSP